MDLAYKELINSRIEGWRRTSAVESVEYEHLSGGFIFMRYIDTEGGSDLLHICDPTILERKAPTYTFVHKENNQVMMCHACKVVASKEILMVYSLYRLEV